jgi:hypothetical protein
VIGSSTTTIGFSDSASVFGGHANESVATISWLGNKLYATLTGGGNIVLQDNFSANNNIGSGKFTLAGKNFELRTVAALATGGTSGKWSPYNSDDTILWVTGDADSLKKLTFGGTGSVGILAFDADSGSPSVDPLDGVTVGSFYLLGNNVYIGTGGSEELIAEYAIDTDDKLTFDFIKSGCDYGSSNLAAVSGNPKVAYFK